MTSIFIVFQLIVLIFSAIIHEISHGAMANRLGDPTAKSMGRLSLNPLKHLEFFGSFLVPVMLWVLTKGSFVFGWAKPVPINPYNIQDQKRGLAKVALAGPASNLIMAIVFGMILRFLPQTNPQLILFGTFLSIIVQVNILLAVFNLIPVPPLDGSKIVFAFLPAKYYQWEQKMEQNKFIVLAIVLIFAPYILWPVISGIYRLIIGV
ncbi:MAG: site-2 protease family protein [Candidatus Paceibacterota bacterium]|jgi:Zn-dependent protease